MPADTVVRRREKLHREFDGEVAREHASRVARPDRGLGSLRRHLQLAVGVDAPVAFVDRPAVGEALGAVEVVLEGQQRVRDSDVSVDCGDVSQVILHRQRDDVVVGKVVDVLDHLTFRRVAVPEGPLMAHDLAEARDATGRVEDHIVSGQGSGWVEGEAGRERRDFSFQRDVVECDVLARAVPGPEAEVTAAVGVVDVLDDEDVVGMDADRVAGDLDRQVGRWRGERISATQNEVIEAAAISTGEVDPPVGGAVDPPCEVAAGGRPRCGLVHAERDSCVAPDRLLVFDEKLQVDREDVVARRESKGGVADVRVLLRGAGWTGDEDSVDDVPVAVMDGPPVERTVAALEVVVEVLRR